LQPISINDVLSHHFSIYHRQLINPHQFSLVNQQSINQLVINLLLAGLQVRNLVIGTGSLDPLDRHFTTHPASSLSLGCLR